MIKRYTPVFDGTMEEWEHGEYVEYDEIEKLRTELARKDKLLEDAEAVMRRQRDDRKQVRAERDALRERLASVADALADDDVGGAQLILHEGQRLIDAARREE